MNYTKVVVGAIIGLLLVSCAGTRNKISHRGYDCSEKMAEITQLYNKGKYTHLIRVVEDVKIQCSGSEIMDSALYFLGMSNIHSKKYLEAQIEFERLAQDFPSSPFYDEARFRIGQAVYLQSRPSNRDQTETNEAVRLLTNYLETNPVSVMADSARLYLNKAVEKLAEKEYSNARFYEKVNEPDAAIIYYKNFIEQYPDSRFRDISMYNLAELLIKLERRSEAIETLDELIKSGKEKPVIIKAESLKKGLSGVAVSTDNAADQE